MITHKGTQTIETTRLILRRASSDDAQAMFSNWASDPEVTRFLTWSTYEHVCAAQKILKIWIGEYSNPSFYQWMIVLKELGEPIGSISVVAENEQIGEIELGYCIGRRWWHRGIVTEALSAVMAFLFAEVGVNRIVAKHDIHNPNSGAVMKKCGMKYEGTHRCGGRNNQGICDLAQYAILRRDWIS